MNVAILISGNESVLDQWGETIARLADALTERGKGAFAVIHGANIKQKDIMRVSMPLTGKFTQNAALPVHTNPGQPAEAQNAGLMGAFIYQLFSRFPGPWIVIDEPTFALDGWYSQMTKLHYAGNRAITGQRMPGDSGIVPIGPVVLDCPWRELKVLGTPSGESWRSRGRFAFAKLRMNELESSELPFSTKPVADDVEATQRVETQEEEPQEPIKTRAQMMDEDDGLGSLKYGELYKRLWDLQGERPDQTLKKPDLILELRKAQLAISNDSH